MLSGGKVHGLEPRAHFPHDLDVGHRVEQGANAGAHESVIVREDHAEPLAHRPAPPLEDKGKNALTIVPSPGADRIWRRPPARPTRSSMPESPAQAPPDERARAELTSNPAPSSRIESSSSWVRSLSST